MKLLSEPGLQILSRHNLKQGESPLFFTAQF